MARWRRLSVLVGATPIVGPIRAARAGAPHAPMVGMRRFDGAPRSQTERFELPPFQQDEPEPPGGPSAGRVAAIVLMLVTVTLIAAGTGYLLAGGQLPLSATSDLAPTSPPLAATQPAAPPKPAVPPTAVPQPTAPPSTPRPPAVAPPPESAAQPTSTRPAASQDAGPAAKPDRDPRLDRIEARIEEYFVALRAQDFARAQQVCCTPAWRERYPLEEWRNNFNGVTDLRLVGSPRYQRVEDDVIVVDTDYTFVSGGARRNFTLRWTFKPVGSEWQAELAEAFPT